MKFAALFTIGFGGTFAAMAVETWRELFTDSDDRLNTFAFAWFATFATVLLSVISYGLLRYAPWGLPIR